MTISLESHRWRMAARLLCVWPYWAGAAVDGQTAGPPGGVVEYAPGLRIDWTHRRVEVDGEVVLREGALELFACTAHSREHESIVVVRPRPLRIYEALGLIGLDPGHPVRYDPKTEKWIEPTGAPLRLDVRWEDHGKQHTCDVGAWLRDMGSGESPPPGVWVFAGSTKTKRGVFTADIEGTVVCVVDFPSALIAWPQLRTADNDSLWLQPATDRIPPVGTPVTLLISPVEPVRLVVEIGPGGEIRCDHLTLSIERLVDRVLRFQKSHGHAEVVIEAAADAPEKLIGRVVKAIRRIVNKGTSVRVQRPGDDGSGGEKSKVDRSTPKGDSGRR